VSAALSSMTAYATDVIFLLRPGTLIHWCQPGHEWPEDFTREQLDPLAQGSCRYCDEPLPIPRDDGGPLKEEGARSEP